MVIDQDDQQQQVADRPGPRVDRVELNLRRRCRLAPLRPVVSAQDAGRVMVAVMRRPFRLSLASTSIGIDGDDEQQRSTARTRSRAGRRCCRSPRSGSACTIESPCRRRRRCGHRGCTARRTPASRRSSTRIETSTIVPRTPGDGDVEEPADRRRRRRPRPPRAVPADVSQRREVDDHVVAEALPDRQRDGAEQQQPATGEERDGAAGSRAGPATGR